MDTQKDLENNELQTFRMNLIHKILQNISTERLCRGQKTVRCNNHCEIKEIYSGIINTFRRDTKDSADIYYNGLCEEIANCVVKCLQVPNNTTLSEDLFSINEATYFLLDLELDSVLIGWKNFTSCVDGAVNVLLGGDRSKTYDIRLIVFIETWFLEIFNATEEMHERIKRAIHAGTLKSIQDNTYYIKPNELCEWAKSKGITLADESCSKTNNYTGPASPINEATLIPKHIWANKRPSDVVADMRAGGYPENAIAYALYEWCGLRNKTEVDSIMRNRDISDSAKRKAINSLLRMAEGGYYTE